MRFIYAMANCVIIWIGVGFDGSDLAFALLKRLRAYMTGGCTDETAWATRLLKNGTYFPNLQGMSKIFTQEYFFRVWVTQEFICAREAEVHCGSDSISWTDLVAVQGMIVKTHFKFESLAEVDRRHPSPYLIQSFVFWGSRLLRLPETLDNIGLPKLSGMPELSYNKHTSDPRDHIYGIIGLSRARNDERLQIYYSKSARQVFVDACAYIISTSQKLDIICARSEESLTFTLKDEFPFWVPDCTYNAHSPVFMPVNFSAASTTRAEFHCDTENGILLARGFCMDRIKDHGLESEMTDWKDTKEATRTLCGWYKLLRKRFKDPRSQWEKFFRALWMEENEEIVTDASMFAAEEIKRYCIRMCPKEFDDHRFAQSTPPYKQDSSWKKGFVNGIASYIYRRMFFIAERQTLGLGPSSLQKGDLVYLLFNSKYPIILRHVAPYYYFIGPAYFQGYMWGFGIKELEESRLYGTIF